MALFVFLCSPAWALQPGAQEVKSLEHAIITFAVEGRTVIVDIDKDYFEFEDTKYYGWYPSDLQIANQKFPEDKLWMTYTGKRLQPEVKSVVVGKAEDAVDLLAEEKVTISYVGDMINATKTDWDTSKDQFVKITLKEGNPAGPKKPGDEVKELGIHYAIKKAPLPVTVSIAEKYQPLYEKTSEKDEFSRLFTGEIVTADEIVLTLPEFEGHKLEITPAFAGSVPTEPQGVGEIIFGKFAEFTVGRNSLNDDNEFVLGPAYEEISRDNFRLVTVYDDNVEWQAFEVEIIPMPVTVSITGNVLPEEDETIEYDGKAHTVEGFEATWAPKVDYELPADVYETYSEMVIYKDGSKPSVSGTNAGTYYMDLKAEEFSLKNDGSFTLAKDDITIAKDGSITISKAEGVVVNIMGKSETRAYNGEELKVEGFAIEASVDFFTKEDVQYKDGSSVPSATTKDAGKVFMELSADDFECISENFGEVEFKIESDGYAEVTPAKVDVTITGNHTEDAYDYGPVYTLTGYTTDIEEGGLYKESYIEFSGTASVTASEVGKTYMLLKPGQFKNTNTNFDVTFAVVDGYIEIDYFNATLADDADNAPVLKKVANKYGGIANVTLARTFATDGFWSTICLPFAVDLTAAGCPLAGAEVRELTEAGFEGGVLTLNFTEVEAMEAGKPYVIKWAEGEGAATPVFNEAEISRTLTPVVFELGEGQSVTFTGTYAPVAFEEADKSVLLVGAENKLYSPAAGASVNAQRAYFQLEGLDEEAAESITMRFGDATAINSLHVDNVANEYYDLSGRRVAEPTKGIYIVNGKKVVIK